MSLSVLSAAPRGDCVDCGLCVATCPTGIDIRNGLQMECVHCTQCIDACAAVMTKLGKAAGLIRYASQSELAGETPAGKIRLRPRLVVYPAIVLVLLSAAVAVLAFRGPLSASIVRTRGGTFSQLPSGVITNPVGIKLINRLETPCTYTLTAVARTSASAAQLRFPDEAATIRLDAGEARIVNTVVEADAASFVNGAMPIMISILDANGRSVADRTYTLLGPMKRFDAQPEHKTPGSGHDADHESEHTDHTGEHS